MILTLTATRRGITSAQRAAVPGLLAAYPTTLLHGGAPGGDEELHELISGLRGFLVSNCQVEVYPANASRHMFWKDKARFAPFALTVQPPEHPLVRNQIMATRADHVLACPETAHEVLRSGTWTTVRAARRAGHRVTIIEPDGTVREERGRRAIVE